MYQYDDLYWAEEQLMALLNLHRTEQYVVESMCWRRGYESHMRSLYHYEKSSDRTETDSIDEAPCRIA